MASKPDPHPRFIHSPTISCTSATTKASRDVSSPDPSCTGHRGETDFVGRRFFKAESAPCVVDPRIARVLSKVRFDTDEHAAGYTQNLRPLAAFMTLLARPLEACSSAESLPLWVPDTVVWEAGQPPTWYFSDEDGFLRATRDFDPACIQRRFQRKRLPDDVVAVAKRPSLSGVHNSTSLVNTKLLTGLLPYLQEIETSVTVQRFVRSGSRPTLLRCRWRRAPKVIQVFAISNGRLPSGSCAQENLLVTLQKPGRLDVQIVFGPSRDELVATMNRIIFHLSNRRHLHLDELVCDFISDETKHLWFLQVKAFLGARLVEKSSVVQTCPASHQEVGTCGFCECSAPLGQLTNVLTGRQVCTVRERMKRICRPLSWPSTLAGAANNAVCVDMGGAGASRFWGSDAYQSFRVCADCYELYGALNALDYAQVALARALQGEDAEIEAFSESEVEGSGNALAVESETAEAWSDTVFAAQELAPEAFPINAVASVVCRQAPSSTLRSRFPSQQARCRHAAADPHELPLPPPMPTGWRCELVPGATSAVVRGGRPTWLLRFRLLLLAQALVGDLTWLDWVCQQHGMLALTWSLLGVKRCVALQPKVAQEAGSLLINAIALQHFYACQEDSAMQWVQTHPQLRVYLVVVNTGQRLAYAGFDLRGIIEGQAGLRLCEAPLKGRGLSGSSLRLRVALGISGGSMVDCEGRSDLRVHMADSIYVPPLSDDAPEALPEVWLALLTHDSDVLGRLDVGDVTGQFRR